MGRRGDEHIASALRNGGLAVGALSASLAVAKGGTVGWDVDRLHMSSAGHQRMAIAVLDALGVAHSLVPHELGDLPEMERRQRRDAARPCGVSGDRLDLGATR
jgi:hypothetical protein